MSQRRNQPIAYPIEAKNTEENIKASRGLNWRRARVFEKQTTTAAYVDSLIFDKRLLKTALITIKEVGGAQSIKYKILGCIDPSDWQEIQVETSIAASGVTFKTTSDAWAFLKVQIKNDSGAGIVLAHISAQSP